MHYQQTTLKNGLRIIHYPTNSPVSYTGFAVHVGSRDEEIKEWGMAHFTEHMLFKGTSRRRSHHILNRMENVGGELNAFTSKEETIVYAVCMNEHTQRACDLLCDIVCDSIFPENEIEKEVDVIIDEIGSYKDNPPEHIYDEFENKLFAGHDLGHNILGEEETLESFDSSMGQNFTHKWYTPENMVFFSVGQTPFNKIVSYVEKSFKSDFPTIAKKQRVAPNEITTFYLREDQDTHQSHVIIGSRAFNLFDSRRTHLSLLNNILGGPGMNSRLNISLREKRGLVYHVESNFTPYTDTGVFNVYFGSESGRREKCIELIHKELKNLRNTSLTSAQLQRAKDQIKGQTGISSDNKENIAMGMSKSFLHFNKYDALADIYTKIDSITASDLLETAQIIFDPNNLSTLIYE